ncbi:MAG TPA: preprotein translocase subunit YajC [Terriglobia bacterium]|nr:preprotein translocase subunit YajC [Terriglobia bacterium]
MIASLFVNTILLAADSGTPGPLSWVLFFAPLFAIWYFLVLRPQSQQRKKLQEMLANLKTGDRVITSGGIYGTIVGFKDNTVQVQIANQVKVDMARSAITGVVTEEASSGKQESGAKGKK